MFPCGDDMVCIIDDREDVWQGCGNLVQVKAYYFFRHTANIHAPPGMNKLDDPNEPGSSGTGEFAEIENDNNKNGVQEEKCLDEASKIPEKSESFESSDSKSDEDVTSEIGRAHV